MKKIRSFAINGTILTICSLLMRTVSVAFNVYVAKCAGAEAMGLYSLLSSVYGFAVTLALSGINLAVTRLVSEALAVNNTLFMPLYSEYYHSLCSFPFPISSLNGGCLTPAQKRRLSFCRFVYLPYLFLP